MSHQELIDYFLHKGLTAEQFWIGPEHPSLERLALSLLAPRVSQAVLEIGFQAGGFAVPIIRELNGRKSFKYYGVDNLSYGNSVSGDLLSGFLSNAGVPCEKYAFFAADARDLLIRLDRQKITFDLVLIDHLKALYPRELMLVLSLKLLAPDGIVLLHDVAGKAREAWKKCVKVCDWLGCTWEIRLDVPEGVAIVRRTPGTPLRALATWTLGHALRTHASAFGPAHRALRRLRGWGGTLRGQ